MNKNQQNSVIKFILGLVIVTVIIVFVLRASTPNSFLLKTEEWVLIEMSSEDVNALHLENWVNRVSGQYFRAEILASVLFKPVKWVIAVQGVYTLLFIIVLKILRRESLLKSEKHVD
jgi:hypothetical protein